MIAAFFAASFAKSTGATNEALMAVKVKAAAAADAAYDKMVERYGDVCSNLKAQQGQMPSLARQKDLRRKSAVAATQLVEANKQIERALATGDLTLLSAAEEAKACAAAATAASGQVLVTWLDEMNAERKSVKIAEAALADAIIMAREAAAGAAKAGRQAMAATFTAARAALSKETSKDAAAVAAAEAVPATKLDASVAEAEAAVGPKGAECLFVAPDAAGACIEEGEEVKEAEDEDEEPMQVHDIDMYLDAPTPATPHTVAGLAALRNAVAQAAEPIIKGLYSAGVHVFGFVQTVGRVVVAAACRVAEAVHAVGAGVVGAVRGLAERVAAAFT